MPAVPVVFDRLQDLTDVTFASIARGNVLYRGASAWQNLAPGTSGQVLQTNGAGADPSWATVSAGATTLDGLTDVNLPSASQGDLLYRNATEWVRLAAGTNGHVLTTGGAGANPAWAAGSSDLTNAVILAPASSARNVIQPTGAAIVPLVAKGAASQSANLQEWQTSDGTVQARVLPTAIFSCPGTGSNTERFGNGAAAAGNNATVFGSSASGAGAQATVFGRLASGAATYGTAFGYSANTNDGNNNTALGGFATVGATFGASTAVGQNAQCQGSNAVAVGASSLAYQACFALGLGATAGASGVTNCVAAGQSASAVASNAIALGASAAVATGHSGSIAIGTAAASTAAGQLLLGGPQGNFFVTQVYLGGGVTNAAPPAVTVQPTGASGTNIAGSALTLAGGKATGNAAGGSLLFQTSAVGSSGTTLQSLVTRMTIDSTGKTSVDQRDALTSTISDALVLGHNTSGTPAAGFGSQICAQLETTTTENVDAAGFSWEWVTATHASRAARFKLLAYDTAVREVIRGEASGTAPMVGFLGAAAVVRQTVDAAATDAATTQSLANSLRTALINLGLAA
jgi:hypothetical protein